jgi:parallel beta helix pectate lyase-like protein
MRQVRLRTLLIVVALVAIIEGAGVYIYEIEIVNPNAKLNRFPADATYVIETDGTSTWAIRFDGLEQFSGTDAYTVIQSAINATAPGIGGTIFIRDGQYPIHKTLLLYRYITLEGESLEGVNLVQGFNGNAITMVARPGDSNLIGFVTVQNVVLSGQRKLYTKGVAIEDVNFSDVTVDRVFIDSFPEDGIRFDTRFYVRITNSWIESNGGDGVDGQGVSYAFIANNVVYNNRDGISQTSPTTSQYGWLLSNNRIVGNSNDGIKLGLNACCDVISGNALEQNANGVELADGGWATRIVDNYFDLNTEQQLKINSIGSLVINGNTFDHARGVSLYNIWTWSAASTIITNNNILSSGRLGSLYISGNRSGLVVNDNPGLNPLDRISAPFDSTYDFIGLNQMNATTPAPGKIYTVAGSNLMVTSSGGSTTVTIRDASGNVVLTSSSLNGFYLPVGYMISWSNITSVNITVYGT